MKFNNFEVLPIWFIFADRVSRHPVRTCSLRLRESRIDYDDDIDDSDIASNDDEDDDEDDAIFSPVKSKRKFRYVIEG